ncbi:uncharacterized protein LOC131675515 [Phymastichus coffea]|uniref:uncharacterized protein LOC131675515 n=1 Tax=Phymastichus coffea TaxID=108790 RepID=UPI00273BCD82|nr:uncharacterized protein LOC131675515 [Phymastichus coffea]
MEASTKTHNKNIEKLTDEVRKYNLDRAQINEHMDDTKDQMASINKQIGEIQEGLEYLCESEKRSPDGVYSCPKDEKNEVQSEIRVDENKNTQGVENQGAIQYNQVRNGLAQSTITDRGSFQNGEDKLTLHNKIQKLIESEVKRATKKSNQNEITVEDLKNTLKLEFLNKGANNFKRDYKLNNNMKFELFLDYFSSELRANNLQHIIDEKTDFSKFETKILEEQKFKVRDILINHLDSNYHNKIINLKEPIGILKTLKEFKRCENNVTSQSVRKTIYTMQYIIGKTKAAEFCENFEDTIRNYENCPGATPLSDDEKRDAFFGAVMVSVPSIQNIEFLTKTTKGRNLTYEELKVLVLQEEATRNQGASATNVVRSANYTGARGSRQGNRGDYCYECGSYSHIGRNCPNRGSKVCYKCNKLGHISFQCPEHPNTSNRGNSRRGNSNFNNSRNFHGYSRGHARGKKRKYNDENENDGISKRGKFRGGARGRFRGSFRERGRGGYRGNQGNNNDSNKGGNQQGNSNQPTNENSGGNCNQGECSIEHPKAKYTCEGELVSNISNSKYQAFHTIYDQSDLEKYVHRFIADSGATEHLTKSKIIFKSLDLSIWVQLNVQIKMIQPI